MRGRTGWGAALAAAVVAATPGAAAADSFDVTRTNDPVPGNCKPRDCSLREAVLEANATPGADVVLLPERRKSYKLTRDGLGEDAGLTGDLDVNNDPLRLKHRGRGTATIDANAIDRVLHVQVGAATTLQRITITGGEIGDGDGGGILSDADLKLLSSTIRGNAASGSNGDAGGVDLDEDGVLTMSRSKVVGNDAGDLAGGINTSGAGALIKSSRISGNEAVGDEGGGLDLAGDDLVRVIKTRITGNVTGNSGGGIEVNADVLKVKKSTISGNRAGIDGGGIYATDLSSIRIDSSTVSGNRAVGGASDGGGMYFDAPTVNIVNTTVAGNSATLNGGGIQAQDGADVTLNAVTVVRNVADADGLIPVGFGGGGLYRLASAGFDVRSSVIALNLSSTTPNDCEGDTPIDSLGNNVISTTTGGACEGFDGPNDLVRSNPKIGPLRRNGGPTETVALKAGSPAIGNAHKPSAPGRDQRGVRRDSNPDSGAFER